ncbi:uncharacterized protein LOC134265145 [Saccostrea cucullata]|uniref:uncharacterized protein LOC134265145 n=1 Tax=Saccostrea cuccullata TaxID=36930 RepID=UPI002ED53E51
MMREQLEKRRNVLTERSENFRHYFEQTKNKIEEHRSQTHKDVDEYFDDAVKTIDDKMKEYHSLIVKLQRSVEIKTKRVSKFLGEIENVENDPYSSESLKSLLIWKTNLRTIEEEEEPSFSTDKPFLSSGNKLSIMFGTFTYDILDTGKKLLHNIERQFNIENEYRNYSIKDICWLNTDEFIMIDDYKKNILSVNMKGYPFEIEGDTSPRKVASVGKHVFYITHNGKSIVCVDLEGKGNFWEESDSNRNRLQAKDLIIRKTGGEMVVLMYCFARNRGKIVTYDLETKKKTCEYAHVKKMPRKILFQEPEWIVENINRDLCTSDIGAKAVVVIGDNGDFRFRYTSHNPDTFSPGGLDCDTSGLILVCDIISNNIHILDQDGYFLRFLYGNGVFPDCQTKSIFVQPSGHAWVTDNEGRINVIRYIE